MEKNKYKIGMNPNSRNGFKKGHKVWAGKHLSDDHKNNIRNKMIGSNNPCWKGDKAKVAAMHDWIKRKKGKPNLCEVCGTTKAKKFEWANIDHKYKRLLEDYIRMCTKCHLSFDRENNRGPLVKK